MPTYVSSGDIKCIPKTEEKYISFTKEIEVGELKSKDGKKKKIKRELRFLDSFKFMASSLDPGQARQGSRMTSGI
jgi:hypothetical protein